jgi:opacity protein-like surface antigen
MRPTTCPSNTPPRKPHRTANADPQTTNSHRACPAKDGVHTVQHHRRSFTRQARACLLATLIPLVAATALAQSTQAPHFEPDLREYGWIEFGGAILPTLDGRLRSPGPEGPVTTDVRLSLSTGFAVAGGFAERITPSLVAEIQGGLFYHNIDKIRSANAPTWSPDASLFQVPVFANLLFEVPLRSRLKPFLGAGIGAAITWLDIDDQLPATDVLPGPRIDRTSTEINLAYQGFAGVRLQLARQGVLAFTYRAVATGSPNWTLKDRETGRSVGSLKAHDALVHSFTLGFLVPF